MLDTNHDFIQEDHASTRKRLRLEVSRSDDLTSLKEAGQEEVAINQEQKKQVFEGVIHKFDLFKLNVLLICEYFVIFIYGAMGRRSRGK